MPLVPVGHEFMDEALVNVPDELTLLTQLFRQPVAEVFVARHLMDDSFEQFWNIY